MIFVCGIDSQRNRMKMVKCSKTSGLIDKNFVYDFHFHLMRSPFRYRSSHSHFRFDRVCVWVLCSSYYYYCERVHEIWFHWKNILISHANREPHSICFSYKYGYLDGGICRWLLLLPWRCFCFCFCSTLWSPLSWQNTEHSILSNVWEPESILCISEKP